MLALPVCADQMCMAVTTHAQMLCSASDDAQVNNWSWGTSGRRLQSHALGMGKVSALATCSVIGVQLAHEEGAALSSSFWKYSLKSSGFWSFGSTS